MEIEHLRLFADVAHQLSFAAVALERDVHPSSVSRAIADIEREVGVRLLQRTTRRMTLTEGGARFFRRVRSILDEFDQAREQLTEANETPRGTLRLSASVAFGEVVIAPLMSEFQQKYPLIALELMFTDQNVDLVSDGIDLAIRMGARIEGDWIASKLQATRYRVCASPSYLLGKKVIRRPSDLTDHRSVRLSLAAFRNTWRFRPNKKGGDEIAVPVDGDIVCSSALSVRSLVRSGAGPALLADWLVRKDLECGRLVDLFPKFEVAATDFDTAAWLLYPSRAFLPRKVRVMIDFLRAQSS